MSTLSLSDDGRIARLTIEAGKGNVIGAAVIDELRGFIDQAASAPELRALVITGAGPHFSFGASVDEHLPGKVERMLPDFHALVRALLRFPVPTVAAVRGQCLGGGLEVALACVRIVAAPDAKLGQPEIRLAVFAPAATALLPARVGQGRADDLLLTGRTVTGEEAYRIGLVDELAVDSSGPIDPLARAEAWAREHLVPLSLLALGRAVRASRAGYVKNIEARLAELEKLYLDETTNCPDAVEGLYAFVERRAPSFRQAHG